MLGDQKSRSKAVNDLRLHVDQTHALRRRFLLPENIHPCVAILVRCRPRGEVGVGQVVEPAYRLVARIADNENGDRRGTSARVRQELPQLLGTIDPVIKKDSDDEPIARFGPDAARSCGSMQKPVIRSVFRSVIATAVVPVLAKPTMTYLSRDMGWTDCEGGILSDQFEDGDADEESGIWIGKDGVGFERLRFQIARRRRLGAALLANGTWTFEGGVSPLRQELAHVLSLELQVCMHVSQF